MHQLGEIEKATLLKTYVRKFSPETLSYGTVRDYCDSCDYLPWLSNAQRDLKDQQRPWTVKAALGLLSLPSRLLEIGGGEPLVASLLAGLGYQVTVIDPYDGSGGGPTCFEQFVQRYPDVRIIRDSFRMGLPQLRGEMFDGIFSISVLEHVAEPALRTLFEAISAHLRPSAWSFHCVDCVLEGEGAQFHREQCARIVAYQHDIAGEQPRSREDLAKVLQMAKDDIDTCYLSAAGHNLWRGGLAYDEFPFRKVISLQFAVQTGAE